MKIGGKKGVGSSGYVKNAAENKQSGQGGQANASGAKQGGEDSVALSPKAMQLNRSKALLDNVPEIRGEMVVRLKTDIESGDYNVDAGKVAEKMIERALINTLHTKK